EDWWFGDLQSFINNTSACFSIQSLEKTKVLSIDKASWDYLLREIPEFIIYTRILFRNTMFSHENRIFQNLSYTAEERYDYFLEKYPTLSQRISQKHIASYIGITPEFLSMLRAKKSK
ncbi:MAG: Crp/Fnr family transcriptional regulator, partial [Bacteroidota bacterium]